MSDLSLQSSSLNNSEIENNSGAPVVSGHTPPNWAVEYCGVSERFHIEAGAFPCGTSICELNGNPNDKANAALIVRAVNNHDALVSALEAILEIDPHGYAVAPMNAALRARLTAALNSVTSSTDSRDGSLCEVKS